MKLSLITFIVLSMVACRSTEQVSTPNVAADEHQVLQTTSAESQIPVRWQEHWLQDPIFNTNVHLVEAGDSSKPTILLVHGLGAKGLLDWIDVIPNLEKNYHVIALDLPGFGNSTSTSEQLDPQKYSQLLSWLIPKFSNDKVQIIGHSMGGAVSLRFSAEYPHMVDKLIMVDTAGVLQRSVFVLHMTQLPSSYSWLNPYANKYFLVDKAVTKVTTAVNSLRTKIISTLDGYPDPAQILMKSDVASQYIYKDRATLNAALGLIYEDLSSAIKSLTIPTHIIWGSDDAVAPLRTGKLLEKELANAQLHVIDGAGHVPMKDKPEQFMHYLEFALQNAPVVAKPIKFESKTIPIDFACKDQKNLRISGQYKAIHIENCESIHLIDVQAHSIEIIDSKVSIESSKFASNSTALIVDDSIVSMTNVELVGNTAMKVKESLVDAAGVSFKGETNAIRSDKHSYLYYSVCSVTENQVTKNLHGMSVEEAN